ncbi:28342_t:CDS:2 [Dentiscutata erythropus]|uniref:28342_t:CDS:1 n=1 Tax=Dentiscutata erythropus TaxID=1348616 RepID=A0A9N9HXD5_9GLOM|nr:28342_t:CDS:2 [Dentiscutata erythropus]
MLIQQQIHTWKKNSDPNDGVSNIKKKGKRKQRNDSYTIPTMTVTSIAIPTTKSYLEEGIV